MKMRNLPSKYGQASSMYAMTVQDVSADLTLTFNTKTQKHVCSSDRSYSACDIERYNYDMIAFHEFGLKKDWLLGSNCDVEILN